MPRYVCCHMLWTYVHWYLVSTIVVQMAIAGRDLSLKDVDVRGECPVSPVMRTVTHLARTVPLCETHDKEFVLSNHTIHIVGAQTN